MLSDAPLIHSLHGVVRKCLRSGVWEAEANNMYDQNVTIQRFLDAAAARQPTPGGGSIAALTGAMSASMGEMVVNYSIGKKGLEPFQDELKKAYEALHRTRALMMSLMAEDQQAYSALSTAKKLPPGDEREKQVAAALRSAIRTPEAIGAASVAILRICDDIINYVNFYLLSDLAVCADLAMATARCSVYNMRVNLSELQDTADRQRIESAIGEMLSSGAKLIQGISPRIWARHAKGV